MEDRQIVLNELRAVLADGSDDVTYDVYVGDSPEAALAATSVFSGTWSEGRNRSVRERARGHVAYIRLRNSTLAERWAMERIQAVIKPLGGASARIY